jgi:hypothetical protein
MNPCWLKCCTGSTAPPWHRARPAVIVIQEYNVSRHRARSPRASKTSRGQRTPVMPSGQSPTGYARISLSPGSLSRPPWPSVNVTGVVRSQGEVGGSGVAPIAPDPLPGASTSLCHRTYGTWLRQMDSHRPRTRSVRRPLDQRSRGRGCKMASLASSPGAPARYRPIGITRSRMPDRVAWGPEAPQRLGQLTTRDPRRSGLSAGGRLAHGSAAYPGNT